MSERRVVFGQNNQSARVGRLRDGASAAHLPQASMQMLILFFHQSSEFTGWLRVDFKKKRHSLRSAAGRRDNAIHSQVLHQLAVMVEGVRKRVDDQSRTSAVELDYLGLVPFVDCGCGPVKISE